MSGEESLQSGEGLSVHSQGNNDADVESFGSQMVCETHPDQDVIQRLFISTFPMQMLCDTEHHVGRKLRAEQIGNLPLVIVVIRFDMATPQRLSQDFNPGLQRVQDPIQLLR